MRELLNMMGWEGARFLDPSWVHDGSATALSGEGGVQSSGGERPTNKTPMGEATGFRPLEASIMSHAMEEGAAPFFEEIPLYTAGWQRMDAALQAARRVAEDEMPPVI
jgi:hypothetical protein